MKYRPMADYSTVPPNYTLIIYDDNNLVLAKYHLAISNETPQQIDAMCQSIVQNYKAMHTPQAQAASPLNPAVQAAAKVNNAAFENYFNQVKTI